MGIILDWCTGCSSYKKILWQIFSFILFSTGWKTEGEFAFYRHMYSTYQEECWVSTSFSSQVGDQYQTGSKPKHHQLYLPILLVVTWVLSHRNLSLMQPSNWMDQFFCAALLHVTSVLVSADFHHLDLISEKTSSHICNCFINLLIPKIKLVILLTVCYTILRCEFEEFGIESTNNPPNSYFH